MSLPMSPPSPLPVGNEEGSGEQGSGYNGYTEDGQNDHTPELIYDFTSDLLDDVSEIVDFVSALQQWIQGIRSAAEILMNLP